MSWQEDKQIQADANIFRAMFPEQTKTPTRIVIWGVIFLLDLILCVIGVFHFELIDLGNFSKWKVLLVFIVVIFVFWLQGILWKSITKLLKRR